MPLKQKNIILGTHITFNLNKGKTYRNRIWVVTAYTENGVVIQRLSADGTKYLTEKRSVLWDTLTRLATIA